jgi:transcriptional regulator with XRE-family HTH domain
MVRLPSRGWTQEPLVERMNLHRTFIGSVECGERNVAILSLRIMANVLRVPLVDLFDEL